MVLGILKTSNISVLFEINSNNMNAKDMFCNVRETVYSICIKLLIVLCWGENKEAWHIIARGLRNTIYI